LKSGRRSRTATAFLLSMRSSVSTDITGSVNTFEAAAALVIGRALEISRTRTVNPVAKTCHKREWLDLIAEGLGEGADNKRIIMSLSK
jgi:ribosomal protein L14